MSVQSVHSFAEKVALVVNGAAGVGRAVALQLALQGAYVVCAHGELEEGDAAAVDRLRSLGTLAHSVPATDPESAVEGVESLFGRLDLLVNCVPPGPEAPGRISETTAVAARLMAARPKALIVNVVHDPADAVFADNLPAHFRQNAVVARPRVFSAPGDLVAATNHDDIARVVLFLLSNESKALNRQVLTAE